MASRTELAKVEARLLREVRRDDMARHQSAADGAWSTPMRLYRHLETTLDFL